MQLKKLLQGTTFAIVAAACAIAVPSVASAATTNDEPKVEPGSIEDAGLTDVYFRPSSASLHIEGTEEETNNKGEVTTPGTQEILVGFGKVKNNAITVSSWDTYDGDSADVDLSKLSNVKDNYIVLSTPGNGKMIVKIPAAPKKIKAKFDAAKGVLTAGSGDSASPAELTVSEVDDKGVITKAGTANLYEYRTAYSRGWAYLENVIQEGEGNKATYKCELSDLSLFQEEGAKLFVRVKATPTKYNDDGEWTQSTDKLKYGDVETAIYVAGTLPGKEAKVSIPAKAKGPKATADYTKGTVKFSSGCEYRIATSEKIYADKNGKAEATSAPTSPTEVKKLYEDVGIALTGKDGEDVDLTKIANANVEVRKAASGKKAASKWGILEVELPRTLTVAEYEKDSKAEDGIKRDDKKDPVYATGSDKCDIIPGAPTLVPTDDEKKVVDSDKDIPYGGAGVAKSKLKESDSKNDVLKVAYTTSSKKADAKPALQITCSGDKSYEVVVKKATDPKDISDSDKPTKVTSKKPVTIKNVEDGACVFVRIAGDKKAKTWVSGYANFGTIDIAKTVKGTKPKEEEKK